MVMHKIKLCETLKSYHQILILTCVHVLIVCGNNQFMLAIDELSVTEHINQMYGYAKDRNGREFQGRLILTIINVVEYNFNTVEIKLYYTYTIFIITFLI